ncbi:helix-turn-helix domain-containing protein [Flavobacterium sp. N3904]|uniref:helix-turn-helix domain-containing protein n=1 Tax=Flavobacterium sp. N3904 TaxID=2986835 RepID=UPI0022249242|nr:helix-turn-helix transcriptional regulator [Flavobacterium sp. N3904]
MIIRNLENALQIRVGKRIQEIRIEKEMSQQDLAAKCNFEKSNMSRLEAGRANATLTTIQIVANALNVPAIELFRFK